MPNPLTDRFRSIAAALALLGWVALAAGCATPEVTSKVTAAPEAPTAPTHTAATVPLSQCPLCGAKLTVTRDAPPEGARRGFCTTCRTVRSVGENGVPGSGYLESDTPDVLYCPYCEAIIGRCESCRKFK